jgi:two-component system LytT family response regulator
VVIVDDEGGGRSALKNQLNNLFDSILEIHEANSVASGIQKIEEVEPDIVLLDVMMGDGSGFDLLENCNYNAFSLIFVTAHEKYAIKAFKFSAIDYLLKPFDTEDLELAMRKSMDESQDNSLSAKLDVLFSNKKEITKLVIPTQKGIEIVYVNDIIRLEADGNYSKIILEDGLIMSSKTLKEFDKILSNSRFFRVHKSYLINMDKVKRFLNEDGGMVVTTDGAKIEIARRRKEMFLKFLTEV